MITYTGGSITNLIKNLNNGRGIWTTDTPARATRYANAQATGEVNPDMSQDLAENAVILTVDCKPGYWTRRDDNHGSLDTAETFTNEFEIKKVTLRFAEYKNTLYGTRHTGYKTREQVIEMLTAQGVEIEVL